MISMEIEEGVHLPAVTTAYYTKIDDDNLLFYIRSYQRVGCDFCIGTNDFVIEGRAIKFHLNYKFKPVISMSQSRELKGRKNKLPSQIIIRKVFDYCICL